jgi:hypothetical protein
MFSIGGKITSFERTCGFHVRHTENHVAKAFVPWPDSFEVEIVFES